MSNLGLGVMIRRMLGGTLESAKEVQAAIGQKIAALALSDNKLRIGLADGSTLVLSDEGQSCCESRYMQTDDDLPYYVGATLTGAEVRDAPPVKEENDYDVHDVQFLVIQTDRGDLTICTHNEHNGYYGGFAIEARLEPADPSP